MVSFLWVMCNAQSADAKMACAFKDEMLALDTRAMQSQLMVAALSCGEHKKYNEFVKKFSADLIESSSNLKNYFSRNYKSDAEGQMNKFITALANEASKKSLNQNSDKFCAAESKLFEEIKIVKKQKVSEFAKKREFASLHNVSSCD